MIADGSNGTRRNARVRDDVMPVVDGTRWEESDEERRTHLYLQMLVWGCGE